MKKKKLKSLVKAARKTAEKDIRLDLIAGLNEIVGKFGEGSKKLTKDIRKGATSLAKKLAKDIKIYDTAIIEDNIEAKAPIEPIVEITAPSGTKKV